MLKRHLITGASILLIVLSMYGLLKTTLRTQLTQSTPAITTSTIPTSTPKMLLPTATRRPEQTPEPAPTPGPEPTSTPKPLKSRVVKHQPDQFRKGALSKEEISALKKAIKAIAWSRNSDPKAAADEDYAAMVKECENSDVRYQLADLITEAVSNDYQPNNEEATRSYIAQLNSNFEAGDKDEQEVQKPSSTRRPDSLQKQRE